MGMFDYFTIDYPLPLESYILSQYRPFINAVMDQDQFQSKDLECCLHKYYIDNNGHLFIDESSFEDTEPELRQLYYHGHITVHAYVPLTEDDMDLNKRIRLEYDLKFTDSLLVSATMLHPTKEELSELHGKL
jgi:hypothetical protein